MDKFADGSFIVTGEEFLLKIKHGFGNYLIMTCTQQVIMPKSSYHFYMAHRVLLVSCSILTINGKAIP